jgi:hypothetical protein
MYLPVGKVNQHLWTPNGPHTIEIVAEDTSGYVATATAHVNVVAHSRTWGSQSNFDDSHRWIIGIPCAVNGC